ncbi:MAG: hypothetical protein GXY34_11830 [Syntrophomonadaceae bacterium]|nr:hypothetical protein [Syntrophomonadaceae bacterium]
MRITANYCQTAIYPQTVVKVKSEEKPVSTNFTDVKTNTTASEKQQTKDVWQELKEEYDIRHCTFQDLCDISLKLYKEGEISFFEHLKLTFDWEKAANFFRRYPGATTDLNRTPADAEGNRDWIAEFNAKASFNMKFGDMDNYVRDTKLAKILSRLEH